MDPIALIPIGKVRSTRTKAADDNWNAEQAHVELDAEQFTSEALTGLAEFSHVEIVFFMNRVDAGTIERRARRPRSNPNWPRVGIFAQRGKNRPNQIGVTVCKILKVEGLGVYVEGLDAIEGTPVLDIKPWVVEFGPRGAVGQPAWITELMRGYWPL